MSRPACGKPASDYRSMWAFGMTRDEREAAFRCLRPEGHQGRCRCTPAIPREPLRPIVTTLPSSFFTWNPAAM